MALVFSNRRKKSFTPNRRLGWKAKSNLSPHLHPGSSSSIIIMWCATNEPYGSEMASSLWSIFLWLSFIKPPIPRISARFPSSYSNTPSSSSAHRRPTLGFDPQIPPWVTCHDGGKARIPSPVVDRRGGDGDRNVSYLDVRYRLRYNFVVSLGLCLSGSCCALHPQV